MALSHVNSQPQDFRGPATREAAPRISGGFPQERDPGEPWPAARLQGLVNLRDAAAIRGELGMRHCARGPPSSRGGGRSHGCLANTRRSPSLHGSRDPPVDAISAPTHSPEPPANRNAPQSRPGRPARAPTPGAPPCTATAARAPPRCASPCGGGGRWRCGAMPLRSTGPARLASRPFRLPVTDVAAQ